MSDRASANVSKRVVLIITSLASLVSPLLLSTMNVALPSIGREFSLEAVLLGWINTSHLLAAAAFMIPCGRLADIYGLRKVFSYGFILLTLSSILGAVSNSAALLILARVLQGISGAMIFGIAVAILTSVFPAEERGKVLGINTGAVYVGLTMGPFLGGVLTQHLGWRSIFFFIACLGLVVTIIIFWRLKGEWVGARGERFDITGSLALSLSIIVLIYGFSILPTMLGIVLFLLGVLGMLGFVRWVSKAESPVFNISLFRNNTVFAFSNLAVLINYCASFAITFLLSLYLQYIKGFSPQTAGLILIAAPCVQIIFAPIAGRLSDRFEPRFVASVGIVFNFATLLMFVFLTNTTALWFIIVALAGQGVGMGFFSSPNTNAIMGSVKKKFLGIAAGTVATMRTCGQMLSMGITMILFSIYIGDAEITPTYYPAFLNSVKVGFTIFTALCFGAIFAQLAGRKMTPEERAD